MEINFTIPIELIKVFLHFLALLCYMVSGKQLGNYHDPNNPDAGEICFILGLFGGITLTLIGEYL